MMDMALQERYPRPGFVHEVGWVHVRCAACRVGVSIPIEDIPLHVSSDEVPLRDAEGVRIGICGQCIRFALQQVCDCPRCTARREGDEGD